MADAFPRPEELARASASKDEARKIGQWPHGSPGDAQASSGAAQGRLLTMRDLWRGKTNLKRPGQRANDRLEDSERIVRPTGLALFEIIARLPHRVGHMGKAEHAGAFGVSKCVKRRRLHLDRKDPP